MILLSLDKTKVYFEAFDKPLLVFRKNFVFISTFIQSLNETNNIISSVHDIKVRGIIYYFASSFSRFVFVFSPPAIIHSFQQRCSSMVVHYSVEVNHFYHFYFLSFLFLSSSDRNETRYYFDSRRVQTSDRLPN